MLNNACGKISNTKTILNMIYSLFNISKCISGFCGFFGWVSGKLFNYG